MIVLSKIPEKYPNLVSAYEKDTGNHAIYHNKVTGQFEIWLNQKIKYKSLICNNPNCPKFGQEFDSIIALNRHNGRCNRKIKPLKMDDRIS